VFGWALTGFGYLVAIIGTSVAAAVFANWLTLRIFEARTLIDAGLWWNRASRANFTIGMAAALAGLPGRDAATARALAALALLDADPGPAGGAAALARRIGVAVELLAGRRGETPAASTSAASTPADRSRPSRPGPGSRPATEPPAAAPPPPAATAEPVPPPYPASGSPQQPGIDDGPDPQDDPHPLAAARRRTGPTAWGGLLFLVGLADEVGLPETLAAHPALAGRPFRWSLHRLALALTAAEPDDPAALAFAGLPPGSEPPSAGAEPPAPEEDAAIHELAARLTAALADRLSPDPAAPAAAGPDPAALLDRVCRRRARVVADPGWIEVHLSLDDVSTPLRRARLDLDPGWVPWLGVVLRFVYD
jgi:hypothetical protein